MKEKWIEDLRDGLSDFEMDAPEGLWESLGVETPVPARNPWRRKIAVAAAIIGVLSTGTGILVWLSRGERIDVSQPMVAECIAPTASEVSNPESTLPTYNERTQSVTATTVRKATIHSNVRNSDETSESYTYMGEDITLYTDTVAQEVNNESQETEIMNFSNHDIGNRKSFHTGISPKRRSHATNGRRYAVAAYASGIGQTVERMGQNLSPNVGDHPFYGDNNPNPGVDYPGLDSDSNGEPDVDFPGYFQPNEYPDGTPLIMESHHHQPIKAGLTFQYSLTGQIGLETGLMYTALASDFKVSQGNKASSGRRQMHYIGVPLNVKLSLWSWKSIDLYLTAGVMGEKCVSNRFQVKSEADGLSLEQYSSQKDKPMQWSVNAAPGLQLKPLPNIGIFAEPGISYYFNDGSSISTIYKDRPWNFNLNIGVRWMLNPGK